MQQILEDQARDVSPLVNSLGQEVKRSTLSSKKLSQDSPLLGERVVVEVELHSAGASLTQVDFHIPIVLSTFNQTFVCIFR